MCWCPASRGQRCDRTRAAVAYIGSLGLRGPVTTEAKAEREAKGEALEARIVERRVEVRPDWRAGVLVGADLGALSLASPLGALEVGAHVERRVLGPLSLGAFALVPLARPLAPAVGLSLSAEW